MNCQVCHKDAELLETLLFMQAHSLDENFTNFKPYAFVLRGHIAEQVDSWIDLLTKFCRYLYALDAQRYQPFFEEPRCFFDKNGLLSFNDRPWSTAKRTKSRITALLNAFDIPDSDFRIYLRQS